MSSPNAVDLLAELLPAPEGLVVSPFLEAIRDQAVAADRSRTIDPAAIGALKGSDLVAMAASASLGGAGASVGEIGQELRALASACPSTAWVMWNHLAVFHLFAGSLGPEHHGLLAGLVKAGETVCFPAGAGSGVRGFIDGDHVRLNGAGAFGTGSRYADWAGVAFVVVDADGQRVEPLDLRFTMVRLDDEAVKIDPTWDGSGVRASATDDIHYHDLTVPLDRCTSWFGANRAETLRTVPVIAHRYREDWVGLSDLWLMWMGVGLVGEAVTLAATEVADRRSILGKRMVSHPTVQLNLGSAVGLTAAASATAAMACREVDDRIAAEVVPSEADYLRQMALSAAALDQLAQAMALLQRSLGGNGLREGGWFDRLWRDFQPMPLHINAHQDRVNQRLGRFVLNEQQDPF